MDKIIESYKEWKSKYTEDYCYDEIFEFLDVQSRGDMIRFMDEVTKMYEDKKALVGKISTKESL